MQETATHAHKRQTYYHIWNVLPLTCVATIWWQLPSIVFPAQISLNDCYNQTVCKDNRILHIIIGVSWLQIVTHHEKMHKMKSTEQSNNRDVRTKYNRFPLAKTKKTTMIEYPVKSKCMQIKDESDQLTVPNKFYNKKTKSAALWSQFNNFPFDWSNHLTLCVRFRSPLFWSTVFVSFFVVGWLLIGAFSHYIML